MSKVSKCFPKRMIPGAKRDLRAEGVGREGCVGVRVCVCVCVCMRAQPCQNLQPHGL